MLADTATGHLMSTNHALTLPARASLRGRAGRQQLAPASQHGAVAVMFALLIIPILGICALALDMAIVYNRKAEMHSLAKAAALSAARRLTGTPAGIANAAADAASSANATMFKNHAESISWSPAALAFGTRADPDGQWVDAATASSMAAQIFYVKVDTSALRGAGVVQTTMARVLSEAYTTFTANSEVIAGRTAIAVTPLAVCAMSNTPAASRPNSGGYNELVEYGFRRGISYDLMNLNPAGDTPLNFIVNPLAMPGMPGDPADLDIAAVGPYVCNGTLGIPGLWSGKIAVAKSFPIASLYRQLNSRFDQYDGGVCTPNGAPPDTNIKAYVYTDMVSPLLWMNTAPAGQTAAMAMSGARLETVADLPPPGGSSAQYGPLWAHAKAVAYSTYLASPVEPTSGYATFATSVWSNLYNGQTAKSSYPGATPYRSTGVNLAKPDPAHAPGVRNRRILNVPLLDCSTTPGSSASVLAVGKFFMTVPATPTAVAAEFGGTVPFDRITGYSGILQ